MQKLVIIFLLLSSTTCWALPQCRGTNASAWHNCEGTYKFSENRDTDGTYTGEWRNGNFNGWGVYRWDNGAIYEGNWRNGKRYGYGKNRWNDGQIAIGEWANDELNGQGSFYPNIYRS